MYFFSSKFDSKERRSYSANDCCSSYLFFVDSNSVIKFDPCEGDSYIREGSYKQEENKVYLTWSKFQIKNNCLDRPPECYLEVTKNNEIKHVTLIPYEKSMGVYLEQDAYNPRYGSLVKDSEKSAIQELLQKKEISQYLHISNENFDFQQNKKKAIKR